MEENWVENVGDIRFEIQQNQHRTLYVWVWMNVDCSIKKMNSRLSSSLDWVVKECLKIFPNLIKRKLVCVLHETKILFFALWMMARSIRVFGKMKQMVSNRNFLCG